MEEKPPAYRAKAAAGNDLSEQLVCCVQQSRGCSPSTAGHEAVWDALLGLGDLNPAFIIGLDTTTTVGQLFCIKKKEAAQHSSRNTLSMTNSFIPSSCLPLCTFPTASEKKRIWMWKRLKCYSGSGGWVLDSLPSQIYCKNFCFSPAPLQCSAESRDTSVQCDNLLMPGLVLNLICRRLQSGKSYWPSLPNVINFIHFHQGSFQSSSFLVGPTYWSQSSALLKSPELWADT